MIRKAPIKPAGSATRGLPTSDLDVAPNPRFHTDGAPRALDSGGKRSPARRW